MCSKQAQAATLDVPAVVEPPGAARRPYGAGGPGGGTQPQVRRFTVTYGKAVRYAPFYPFIEMLLAGRG